MRGSESPMRQAPQRQARMAGGSVMTAPGARGDGSPFHIECKRGNEHGTQSGATPSAPPLTSMKGYLPFVLLERTIAARFRVAAKSACITRAVTSSRRVVSQAPRERGGNGRNVPEDARRVGGGGEIRTRWA
jgi:hypothetical protein